MLPVGVDVVAGRQVLQGLVVDHEVEPAELVLVLEAEHERGRRRGGDQQAESRDVEDPVETTWAPTDRRASCRPRHAWNRNSAR